MKTMDQVIREHFIAAGEELNWVTSRMAKALGMTVRTINNYKHKYVPHLVELRSERNKIKEKDRWYNQDKW